MPPRIPPSPTCWRSVLIEQEDAAKRSRGLQLADVNALQFPRSAEVAATLGWALYRAGRLDQAEQKLRAAVTGGRTTADIAYFLASVLADKGQDRRRSQAAAIGHRPARGVRSPR